MPSTAADQKLVDSGKRFAAPRVGMRIRKNRPARSVTISLIAGLLALSAAIALTLSGSRMLIIEMHRTPEIEEFGLIKGDTTVCQAKELLPAGAEAISPSIYAAWGPSLAVTAYSHGRLVTSGTRGSGWIGVGPTVSISPVRRSVSNAEICIRMGDTGEDVGLAGNPHFTPHARSSTRPHSLPGRITIFYNQRGGGSWWSNVSEVAGNIGFGHTPSGSTLALLLLALMAAFIAGGCWLTIRELQASSARHERHPTIDRAPAAGPEAGRNNKRALLRGMRNAISRVPLAAGICAVLAVVNAICWSLIVPPFQIPDESEHVAYVQQLAETQSLPISETGGFSPEQEAAESDLRSSVINLRPKATAIFSAAERQSVEASLARSHSRRGSGTAGKATSTPPLYYALETVPYTLASKGTILDRIELMRLLSALMGGITAFFAYLFLRETLPRARWTWAVGGFGVAAFPTLGFISGGVHPDAMLFAVCSALFYCLARGFRRGLDSRLAIAIGAVIAIGLLTKLNFLGVAPGALLGLLWLTWRQARGSGRATYAKTLLPALAIIAVAVLSYMLVNSVSGRPLLGVSLNATGPSSPGHHSLIGMISYIWQFYLPRLPGMHDYFGQLFTTRQLWFNGLVGLYGWLDTQFPGWVYDIALIPAAAIAALALIELAKRRASFPSRIPELAVYAIMACGLLLLIGASGYRDLANPSEYAQPRYLLPLLPLWGALLALAARAPGRRWGPVVGTLLIVLLLSHDIFSQLQTIARYYA